MDYETQGQIQTGIKGLALTLLWLKENSKTCKRDMLV